MNRRPISVTVIGCLFIAAGVVGFVYHSIELHSLLELNVEWVWVLALRLLAVLGGFFVIRGRNWARWLVLVWLVYHVILSAFHPISGLIIHALLLVVIAYFLFRPQASAYFRGANSSG